MWQRESDVVRAVQSETGCGNHRQRDDAGLGGFAFVVRPFLLSFRLDSLRPDAPAGAAVLSDCIAPIVFRAARRDGVACASLALASEHLGWAAAAN